MADFALAGLASALSVTLLGLFGVSDRFIQVSTATACLYFAAAFRLSRRFGFFEKVRSRAWVLTLACASPLGPFGCYRAASMAMAGTLFEQSAHFSADPVSRAATAVFVAFLVCDTLWGLRNYQSQFELVAGWIHHAVYLVFFALCLRWQITAAVAITFPLEITTIVLAAGHLFPELRSDWLFGASFLLFRLAYHAMMLGFYYKMEDPLVTVWPFMAAVLLLHLHWFRSWAKGMARRGAKKTTSAD
mmetsp:Transcript_38539/g.95351  ORF Transcript_38539/g.95351 Transcript_38539/m.95351 type:complete len:246 (-) Transcript_38539:84-821(-)